MDRTAVVALLVGLALSACNRIPILGSLPTAWHASQEKADQQKLRQMRTVIDSLVGTAACDSVEDCRYTGLGAKACGGPQGYLIYSVTQTDTAALAVKVAEYNRFEQEMNRTYGYVSDCAMVAEPVLGRLAGRCTDLSIISSVQLRKLAMVDSFEGVAKSDPFELKGGRVEGDVLFLKVAYSGGCQYHEFSLWATQGYEKSLPPRHPLRLTHQANGDGCEAYIEEELRFDLAPLRQIHAGQDRVMLYVDNPDSLIEYRPGSP
jgi:hypothetical protein